MSDPITAFLKFLMGRLGLQPASIAAIALVVALALALHSIYLFVKLRSASKVIHRLGESLGYDPPFGDGTEIVSQEQGKDALLHEKEVRINQLEERVAELETDGSSKDANLTVLQQRSKELEEKLQQASRRFEEVTADAAELTKAHRSTAEELEQRLRDMEEDSIVSLAAFKRRSKELEEQLQQSSLRNDEITAQAGEHAKAYLVTMEQLEQRIRDIESESNANQLAHRQRTKELEDQLQQAYLRNDHVMAQAGEQAQSHSTTIEQLEQRMREMEAESIANLTAHQQRAKELEDQLQQASHRNDEVAVQAAQEAQAHRTTVEQLEGRLHDIESESNAKLSGYQQRAKELGDQLQQAFFSNDEVRAQAGEQVQAHRTTIEQLEQRMRDMQAESSATLTAHQQHAKELEDQLQQASNRNDEVRAQAGEQVQAHRAAIEQLEQRMRDIQAESIANLTAHQQRAKELEDQVQQAAIRNDQVTAQAGEQVQAHRSTIEQLEQRMRDMEAENNAKLSAHQQRVKELEDQLQQATIRNQGDDSITPQETLEWNAGIEQLGSRIRDLEAEKNADASHRASLQARVAELEDQLLQAASRMPLEKTETVRDEVAPGTSSDTSPDNSKALMQRAEWITARAVGPNLLHGLVAAEAYTAAAIAANPHSFDAQQLLAELARIRRAYPEGLPSVIEAVTTFDERAAGFFAADPTRAANTAESEALRRYRAGLDRSALLVVNLALELRRQAGAEHSPATQKLQEVKASLLSRLSGNAKS